MAPQSIRQESDERRVPSVCAPLKVAHVVLSLEVGGLERVVLDLVREGARFENSSHVVCLERRGTLADQAESLGARVACFDKQPGLRPSLVRRLAKAFRKTRPDVVHTHQVGGLFYAGPAARLAGVSATVHTEHGKHYSQRARTRWLGRLAGRCADKFCCVSQDIADEVLDARIVRREKIAVVANGIDTARFERRADTSALRSELCIPAEAPVVGTIGRLTEIKRQDVLIRAFALLAQGRPDAHLVIVGDGPLRGELEQLTASLGIQRQVRFVGYQGEPQQFLQLMNVFALTSRSEGMPLSVLEAWAASVPVIGARVGGLPELIEDRKTGLLFAFEDYQTLAEQLAELLTDRRLAAELASAAKEHVKRRFSLGRMADEYQRLYKELLEVAQSRRLSQVH